MKLPQSKKERIRFLVLVACGAIMAIAMVVQFAITPFLASRRALQTELDDYQQKLQKARKELSFTAVIQREYDEATNQIGRIAAENVLRPILGSYLVGVTEFVEATAKEVGCKLNEVQEIGVQEFPSGGAKNAGPAAYRSYSIQIGVLAPYGDICTFLEKLERSNPYLCVTEIRITGQPDAPERHRVQMRLEWPIEVQESKPIPAPAPKIVAEKEAPI